MNIKNPTLNKNHRFLLLKLFIRLCTFGIVIGFIGSFALAQNEHSLEGLYLSATEKSQAGDFKGALACFKEIISTYGTPSLDGSGSGIGNIYFDYGTCLLQLFRWEDARKAFNICVKKYPNKNIKSKIDSTNSRWGLAIFQWGYCEQMLKNPEKALELYQRYSDLKTTPQQWKSVRNIYILRVGGALISSGKFKEGEAELTKLFDNHEEWEVEPQFLMQGLLELGIGWTEQAKKIDRQISPH